MIRKHFFNPFSYAVFLIHGGFFAGNQLLIHQIGRSLGATDMQQALLIASLFAGTIGMVLLLGEFSGKVGKRKTLSISTLCYAAGALLVVLSGWTGWISLSGIGLFLYGCGVGGFEGQIFSLIGDLNGETTIRQMNLTQAFFSLGAVIAPMILGWVLPYYGFELNYLIVGVSMGLVAFLLIRSHWIDELDVHASAQGGGVLFRLVKNSAMRRYMLILMVYIGCESALTYWLASYFEQLGAENLGAFGLSMYWVFSIPGRLLASRIRKEETLLVGGFILCAAGLAALVLIPNPIWKLIGLAISGIALAPAYPSITSLGGRLFPRDSGAAFSLMVFSAGLGGVVAQPIISAVSNAASFTVVYLGIAAIMIVMAWGILFKSKVTASA